jgi:non-ribosomal peptide synthetase component E (peptide arylation enzyme)
MAQLRLPPVPEATIRHYRETGDWPYDALCDWLFTWAERTPETPAIYHAGSRISYRELSDRVKSLAGGLQALGISRGDVVALQLPNLPEFVVSHLALCLLGELQAGAYTRPDDPPEVRHASAGLPSAGTRLRVVLDDGSDAAPDGEGELWVQGGSIFDGYLNNEEATREAFTGHDATQRWFRTGDLGTLSAAGHVTLTGRVKEIINRGGVKFSPIDVEAIIDEMPAVMRSALVPYSDPVLGERACAVVMTAAGTSLSLEDITQTLNARGIARFKWPERLQIVDEMPLTPTQKIMRGELKRQLDQRP